MWKKINNILFFIGIVAIIVMFYSLDGVLVRCYHPVLGTALRDEYICLGGNHIKQRRQEDTIP